MFGHIGSSRCETRRRFKGQSISLHQVCEKNYGVMLNLVGLNGLFFKIFYLSLDMCLDHFNEVILLQMAPKGLENLLKILLTSHQVKG